MASDHATLSVGSAQSVFAGEGVETRDNVLGRPIVVTNEGPGVVYGGAKRVTPEDYGFTIIVGEKLVMDCGPGDIPYLISESGTTSTVRVYHLGV